MEKKPIKVGDTIFVEQAWEDDAGNYHDAYAKVIGIEDGRLALDFGNTEINEFLADAEYLEKDYEPEE